MVRILLLALILVPATALHAQERFGGLSGTVVDAGGVLPGVTVIITNLNTDRSVRLVTNNAGMYRVLDLEPGRYLVRFDLAGFAAREAPAVTVFLGKTLELGATLEVGSLAEAVQVTSKASPLIDLRTTTVAHNVGAEEMALLPKTRSFQSLAATAPSVNAGVLEGGFQVNGASGAENTFTIDGVVTGSLFNGRSRQNTVFEYVQEVQVKTAGISAEYGGAMGGVVSAVTMAGGNTFRGEAHYYYEGSATSAAPVRRLVLSPVDDKTVTYTQDAEQPEHQHELGGSLGGPLRKDRLFFFGSFSPAWSAAPTSTASAAAPSPAASRSNSTTCRRSARSRTRARGSTPTPRRCTRPPRRRARCRPTTARRPTACRARWRATPPTSTAGSRPPRPAPRPT